MCSQKDLQAQQIIGPKVTCMGHVYYRVKFMTQLPNFVCGGSHNIFNLIDTRWITLNVTHRHELKSRGQSYHQIEIWNT